LKYLNIKQINNKKQEEVVHSLQTLAEVFVFYEMWKVCKVMFHGRKNLSKQKRYRQVVQQKATTKRCYCGGAFA